MNLEQRVTPSPQVIFQEVGGETILLDMGSEQYFGLDEIGTRLWSLLQEDNHLGEAVAVLLQEYEVERVQLEQDLDALLSEMLDAGLITLEPV